MTPKMGEARKSKTLEKPRRSNEKVSGVPYLVTSVAQSSPPKVRALKLGNRKKSARKNKKL